MTNEQRLASMGVDIQDIDDVLNAASDEICELCMSKIEKNLNPQNPACEGSWCSEAMELYLSEEVDDGRQNM